MSRVAFRSRDKGAFLKNRENVDGNQLVQSKIQQKLTKPAGKRSQTLDPVALVDYAAENFTEEQLESLRQELDHRGLVMSYKRPQVSPFFCGFCSSNLVDPVVTECGHMFCGSCMEKWARNSAHCPVCASEIDERRMIRVRGATQTEPIHVSPAAPASLVDEHPRVVQVLVLLVLALLVELVL